MASKLQTYFFGKLLPHEFLSLRPFWIQQSEVTFEFSSKDFSNFRKCQPACGIFFMPRFRPFSLPLNMPRAKHVRNNKSFHPVTAYFGNILWTSSDLRHWGSQKCSYTKWRNVLRIWDQITSILFSSGSLGSNPWTLNGYGWYNRNCSLDFRRLYKNNFPTSFSIQWRDAWPATTILSLISSVVAQELQAVAHS